MSRIPILGQSQPQPDRFDREYGGVYHRDETAKGDLHDSEILQIETILDALKARYSARSFELREYEEDAKDRFFKLGFAIEISWHEFAIDGKKVEGALMPDITIVGRVNQDEFDHDRKVHEIGRNILELDQPTGVIRSDGQGPVPEHRH
jgi:molybdopterin converting factor small subunit